MLSLALVEKSLRPASMMIDLFVLFGSGLIVCVYVYDDGCTERMQTGRGRLARLYRPFESVGCYYLVNREWKATSLPRIRKEVD